MIMDQSFSSSLKKLFTGLSKSFDSFSAKSVEGTYRLVSIELMVCRDTPIFCASSSCVRLRMARSTFKVFFMNSSFLETRKSLNTPQVKTRVFENHLNLHNLHFVVLQLQKPSNLLKAAPKHKRLLL